MDANSVIEARKKAEHAVADMAEGELKLIAFEIILKRLLSVSEEGVPDVPGHGKRRHRARSGHKSGQETQADVAPVSAPTRILELKNQGFFDEERGIGEIRDELQTHGWRYDVTALSGPLMKLVRARELRRVKVDDGSKTVYKYFNP